MSPEYVAYQPLEVRGSLLVCTADIVLFLSASVRQLRLWMSAQGIRSFTVLDVLLSHPAVQLVLTEVEGIQIVPLLDRL